jgi:hypothetical protein
MVSGRSTGLEARDSTVRTKPSEPDTLTSPGKLQGWSLHVDSQSYIGDNTY